MVRVICDKVLTTCSAGGVEIHGLHPTVAPHRPNLQNLPVVEQSHFVPYIETVSQESETVEYYTSCKDLMRTFLAKLLSNGYNEKMHNLEQLRDCLRLLSHDVLETGDDILISDTSSGETLLQLLKDINNLEHTKDLLENVSNLILSRLASLNKDKVLGLFLEPYWLKTCLAVVVENTSGYRLKVTEFAAARGQMYNYIMPQLDTEPMLAVEYFTLNEDWDDDQQTEKKDDVNKVTWKNGQKLPSHVMGVDLVVINFLFTFLTDDEVKEALQQAVSCVKDQGFIMIHCPVKLSEVLFALGGLSNCTNGTQIGDLYSFQSISSVLKEMSCEPIAQKSCGKFQQLLLLRKIPAHCTDYKTISVSDLSYEWVDEIKTSMVTENQDVVLEVGKGEASGIIGMVNCLRKEPGGDRFR